MNAPPEQYKILFAGPVGSGKTTAISVLSDVPIVNTDQKTSDVVSHLKATTTTAMDYGVYHPEPGVKIHLYGTPGQERFDFMWDILQLNIDALILLIGDARRAPQDVLGHFLQRFSAVIEKTPTLVVINRFSAHPPPLDVYRAKLASGGFSLPILTIDARIREDLIAVIKCALPLIESHQS